MKAQVKGTNIIFDVEEVGDGGVSYDIRLVEFIDSVTPQQTTTEPDWNQIMIQASIAAMQGLLANPNRELRYDGADQFTGECIERAESLIAELKKQQP